MISKPPPDILFSLVVEPLLMSSPTTLKINNFYVANLFRPNVVRLSDF